MSGFDSGTAESSFSIQCYRGPQDNAVHNRWKGEFPERKSLDGYIREIAVAIAGHQQDHTGTQQVLLIGAGVGLVIDAMIAQMPNRHFCFDALDIADASPFFPTQAKGVHYHQQDATEYLEKCEKQYDVIVDDAYSSIKVLPLIANAYHPWHRVAEWCLKPQGLLVINYFQSLQPKRNRHQAAKQRQRLLCETSCFQHLGLTHKSTKHIEQNSVLAFQRVCNPSVVSDVVLEAVACFLRADTHNNVIVLDQGGGFAAWLLHKKTAVPVVAYSTLASEEKVDVDKGRRALIVIDRCHTNKAGEMGSIAHLGTIAPRSCSLFLLDCFNRNEDTERCLERCGLRRFIRRDNLPIYRWSESSQHASLKQPWYLQWHNNSLIWAQPLEITKCAAVDCPRATWCQPLCAHHTQQVFGVRLGESQYGMGLFATRVFHKNDLIVPYMGKKPNAQQHGLGFVEHSAYVIQGACSRKKVDGAVSRGLGAMANHPPKKMKANANQSEKGPNCKVFPAWLCDHMTDFKARTGQGVVVWLQANTQINPGDEILLNYGSGKGIILSRVHRTVEQPSISEIENGTSPVYDEEIHHGENSQQAITEVVRKI
jgi:hypothetical protein